MGKDTKIEWCDYTFNPWIGCTKVSQECKNCYAETMANRYFKDENLWGPDGGRHITSEQYWKQPLKWNKDAAGERKFVFCASLADWAEDRDELILLRMRLFDIIRATPNLTWLLLTKRYEHSISLLHEMGDQMPQNIMLGFTTGTMNTLARAYLEIDTARSEKRMPPVKLFLSCEPLLEDISPLLSDYVENYLKPDWVIVGGESGPKARPTHPDWVVKVQGICAEFDIPFLFKQWGEWQPIGRHMDESDPKPLEKTEQWISTDGRQDFQGDASYRMRKVGKKAAGRLLDGREWNEFPKPKPQELPEDPDLFFTID